jgi:hypothetical protein
MTERLDLSDWLWHFTREKDAKVNMRSIIESGCLRGGTDRYCPIKSVCLTEMPITEAIRQQEYLRSQNFSRLSNFGIGFKKSLVFKNGGLPVIYQPEKYYEMLQVSACDL